MWDPLDDGRWWHQRPSFREPVIPPTSQPCDTPLVCISINTLWVPYLVGALTQLAQPSTWKVASASDLADVLARVQDVIAIIGEAMPCVTPVPEITGSTTSSRACNIAGYLANVLIKDSIQQAIDAINNSQTLLGYGRYIIGAIPGAGEVVTFLIDALSALYTAVSSGSLSDYQDAVADPTLWSKITCAIYDAIAADGQVTDSNWAAVVANVGTVTYTHSEIVPVIVSYLIGLGPTAVQQLQATGVLADYDCSGCGGGTATGPGGLPVQQQAGTQSLTIVSGTGAVTVSITFAVPFLAAPVITVNCEDPVLIASAGTITMTGFDLTITAAVDVGTDTTATVDWVATIQRTIT